MNKRIETLMAEDWVADVATKRTIHKYPMLRAGKFDVSEHEDDGIAEYYHTQVYEIAREAYIDEQVSKLPRQFWDPARSDEVIGSVKRTLRNNHQDYWGGEPWHMVDEELEAEYWRLVGEYSANIAEQSRFKHDISIRAVVFNGSSKDCNHLEVYDAIKDDIVIEKQYVIDTWAGMFD
jgi:hypothetical protein